MRHIIKPMRDSAELTVRFFWGEGLGTEQVGPQNLF